MNKRAIFIHGWEGYPEEGWRPWLKKELEKRGFEVINPAMPDTIKPLEDKWVSHLAKIIGVPGRQTYLVGHSLGGITILRYLEALKEAQKIGGAILVASFGGDLEYEGYKGELKSFFQTSVNWEKVKKHCSKFVAIHSTDDPWVSSKNLKLFEEKLGAKTIMMDKMKHFSGDDGIAKLPIVLKELLEISDANQPL